MCPPHYQNSLICPSTWTQLSVPMAEVQNQFSQYLLAQVSDLPMCSFHGLCELWCWNCAFAPEELLTQPKKFAWNQAAKTKYGYSKYDISIIIPYYIHNYTHEIYWCWNEYYWKWQSYENDFVIELCSVREVCTLINLMSIASCKENHSITNTSKVGLCKVKIHKILFENTVWNKTTQDKDQIELFTPWGTQRNHGWQQF